MLLTKKFYETDFSVLLNIYDTLMLTIKTKRRKTEHIQQEGEVGGIEYE